MRAWVGNSVAYQRGTQAVRLRKGCLSAAYLQQAFLLHRLWNPTWRPPICRLLSLRPLIYQAASRGRCDLSSATISVSALFWFRYLDHQSWVFEAREGCSRHLPYAVQEIGKLGSLKVPSLARRAEECSTLIAVAHSDPRLPSNHAPPDAPRPGLDLCWRSSAEPSIAPPWRVYHLAEAWTLPFREVTQKSL